MIAEGRSVRPGLTRIRELTSELLNATNVYGRAESARPAAMRAPFINIEPPLETDC